MKNVDVLLRLAWLEGLVNTHGAYEKAVAGRVARAQASAQERSRLIGRLEAALASRKEPVPLTVGALLKSLRGSRGLAPQEIFARIGVTKNIYALMEQDAISPLKIPAEAWRRLMELLHIPLEDMSTMIRRTCQLAAFRGAFAGMLARYKGTKRGKKKVTLEKAYTELYTRAELSLPRDEEERLNELLARIETMRAS